MMPTIRDLREARGLTQKELAQQVGVSALSVYNWEGGRKVPGGLHLFKLANVLGVAAGDIELLSEQLPPRRPGRPRKDQP